MFIVYDGKGNYARVVDNNKFIDGFMNNDMIYSSEGLLVIGAGGNVIKEHLKRHFINHEADVDIHEVLYSIYKALHEPLIKGFGFADLYTELFIHSYRTGKSYKMDIINYYECDTRTPWIIRCVDSNENDNQERVFADEFKHAITYNELDEAVRLASKQSKYKNLSIINLDLSPSCFGKKECTLNAILQKQMQEDDEMSCPCSMIKG